MVHPDASSTARSQRSYPGGPGTPARLGKGQAPAQALLPTPSWYIHTLLVLPRPHQLLEALPELVAHPSPAGILPCPCPSPPPFASLSTPPKANLFIPVFPCPQE